MASGIRLADGWLTARDVCSLRLPASAVVLNACESGRGLVGAGDEQLGLVRGFLIAGASCLVVGLWPMHDRIARELVAAMYSRWYSESHMELRRLGAALRYAQLKVMREWPHPAAWAAFTCVGAS
jgi:CHAT domain-containing protein